MLEDDVLTPICSQIKKEKEDAEEAKKKKWRINMQISFFN